MKKAVRNIAYVAALAGAFFAGKALYSPTKMQMNIPSTLFAAQTTEKQAKPYDLDSFRQDTPTNDLTRKVKEAENRLVNVIESAKKANADNDMRKFQRYGAIFRMVKHYSEQIDQVSTNYADTLAADNLFLDHDLKWEAKVTSIDLQEEIEKIRKINPDTVGGYP